MSGDAILSCDYGAGERYWKFWVTNEVEGVTVKLLSKRLADGRFEYAVVCENGGKKTWGRGTHATEAELLAAAAEFTAEMEDRRMRFEMFDFSGCATMDQFHYRASEGTQWEIAREPGT